MIYQKIIYSTFTPLLSAFLHNILIRLIISTYITDVNIDKILNELASILTCVVLNSYITEESNKSYIKIINRTAD